ncbi:MAG: FAD-binding oxidoreductase, partial [Nitrospira sp.]
MSIATFSAHIDSVKDLTHDVRQLDLRLVEPATIEFKPGQFISFEIPHPETGRLITRAYSIASSPSRPDVITLLFNRVSGGPGSTWLYGLQEGDMTRFKGPAGHFTLRDDPGREQLFIATGTGITPIWAMLLANAERPDPKPATLFWGLRSQRDVYYQEDLLVLARKIPTMTTVLTLTRPEPGWTGETGRVQRLVEERVTSVANLAVYLCGSGGMIADVTATLQQKGLCPIYREKYYDAAKKA